MYIKFPTANDLFVHIYIPSGGYGFLVVDKIVVSDTLANELLPNLYKNICIDRVGSIDETSSDYIPTKIIKILNSRSIVRTVNPAFLGYTTSNPLDLNLVTPDSIETMLKGNAVLYCSLDGRESIIHGPVQDAIEFFMIGHIQVCIQYMCNKIWIRGNASDTANRNWEEYDSIASLPPYEPPTT